jgi:hypothetical protein
MDGTPELTLYPVYAFGNDPLPSSAQGRGRNGGFIDANGNNRPDGPTPDYDSARLEWDANGDAGRTLTSKLRRLRHGKEISRPLPTSSSGLPPAPQYRFGHLLRR